MSFGDDQTKLLILSGLADSRDLATKIRNILRDDYKMGNSVEMLRAKQNGDVPRGTLKNHLAPLVIDFFPDKEAQVDVGRNQLKDIISGKHVAIVQYLYNPTSDISLNDRLINTIGILDVLKKGEVHHKTLVSPYTTYLRSHSIEKYENQGFFQFDSLTFIVNNLFRYGDLDTMISIDPHSEKIKDLVLEVKGERNYQAINPFQSTRSINPAKLGLTSKVEIERVMPNLRPFHERFKRLKEKYGEKIYFVSADNGTESRVENFTNRAYNELENPYIKMLYFDKHRQSYVTSTTKLKHFSESNIDAEGAYIIIDDMFASGGTADKVASMIKEKGAKYVEGWFSHMVTAEKQIEKAKKIRSIDNIVCLNTITQDTRLQADHLEVSEHLLAAELYKAHENFLSRRVA